MSKQEGSVEAMSRVEILQVSKSYDRVQAVSQVSLQIEDGEFFALLGPSGSGKTTILRLIAGFIEPDQGKILIGGQDMAGIPPERRDIGVVFQNYALFPHLTAWENVAFGLEVRRLPKREIAERVREAFALVQLEGMEHRYPRQLSGGQQQRVALARALVTHPRVLLLDEPLGALDKKLRTQMQVELRQLQQSLGITAIFVTHDQEEALTLADRIAVMDRGRICQVGEPALVYERPANLFVSNFLGQSNVFRGIISHIEAEFARIQTEQGYQLVSAWRKNKRLGEAAVLVVRPEKVRLATQPTGSANEVRGKVIHRIYLGTNTTYLVELEGGEVITAFVQNRSPRAAFELGEVVYASWEAENCFLLDEALQDGC
ncbi:MAG: ABC transporter ATP-binding protein [Anaerolineales bacterium]|nr:ABC transporter ATP-binding protein [Anaerolineales bacterium]MCS7248401.1 ABC transporter ATP-binding protein [Anaerolineales bacterium]MDW8162214.1 ABC transporter ATP-binding protein [Anaerolineales bacterium]MDW8445798.1 ABC transporter ATP-binding protein [Anaerolineales bacterium]